MMTMMTASASFKMASLLTSASFLCLLVGSHLCMASILDEETQLEILANQEKAQFHLKELQKSLGAVDLLRKRSSDSGTKSEDRRDTETATSELLLSSLLNFCHQIQGGNVSTNSPNEISPDLATLTPIAETSGSKIKPTYSWIQPDVNPIRIEAFKRSTDRIAVRFLVNQTTDSQLTMVHGLHVDTLRFTQSAGYPFQVISNVTFNVNISKICETEYAPEGQFIFQRQDQRHAPNTVYLFVDVCRFHKNASGNADSVDDVGASQRYQGLIGEDITLPKLQILSEHPGNITVARGRNETFDLRFELQEYWDMALYAMFYDETNGTFLNDRYYNGFFHKEVGYTRQMRDSDKQQLFDFKVIASNVTENKTGEEADRPKTKVITIRVTLLTASGQLSGKLLLMTSTRYTTEGELVKFAYVTYAIDVRRPLEAHVFPQHKAFIESMDKVVCTENGNRDYERLRNNCTISCSAFGRDLQSLTITRKDRFGVPMYGQRTIHFNGGLQTMVDLGRATPFIEGTYLCTAQDKSGRLHTYAEEIHLYTSSFPHINETGGLTVTSVDNVTSLVRCTATGLLPMNVSVNGHEDSRWTQYNLDDNDDEPSYGRQEIVGEKRVTVTFRIPSRTLRFPVSSLECKAENEAGTVFRSLKLNSDVISDYNEGSTTTTPFQ